MFSVVISTRNRADRVQRLVDSLQAQDHDDLEVIVVDDGSDQPVRITGDNAVVVRTDQSEGACAAKNGGAVDIRRARIRLKRELSARPRPV